MQRPIVPSSARAPLRPREILTLLVALALIVATALLGRWQWGRGQTKQQLAARIEASMRGPALVQGAQPLDAARDAWRPLRASGSYAAEWTVFLQNRQYDGRSGFWVLTPLRLAGTSRWIMVERGWVASAFQPGSLVPGVPTPRGAIEVSGRLAPAPSQWFSFAKDAPDAVIRQNVQLASFAAAHRIELMPYVLQQLAPCEPGLVCEWPRADTGMERNFGYAYQWWAMSLLGAGLMVYFTTRRLRRGAAAKEPH
ncbi:SURF1 family protein [mine drainage metagenome]|jgi:cytochrome oxidase assembly protein ShyY1|uniref:SURF1 family protein n=1 Tax=mine drainage metagenome TaxID=410659 RepID=A0A1J5R5R1_9ZZZZ